MTYSLSVRVRNYAIEPMAALNGPSPTPLPPAATMDVFDGTSGDDNFTGTGGDDTFNMADGGNDTVNGRGGNDTFKFGDSFETFGDHITGGSGSDTTILNGASYTGFFTINASMMTQVERLELRGGHQYSIVIASGVQNGKLLTIDASDTVSSFISTSGIAPDGEVHWIGGNGNDHFQANDGAVATLEMGAGFDTVHFSSGKLKLDAGADDDTIISHGGLSTNDKLKGGEGTDEIVFTGDHDVVLANKTVKGFETFRFLNLNDFFITTADGTVGAGQTLVVDATNLADTHILNFNGTNETDGFFDMTGGDDNDVLKGGGMADTLEGAAGDDVLSGRGDADFLTGGNGNDEFHYAAVSDSTGLFRDRITAIDADRDTINVPGPVTDVDDTISTGTLSSATLEANMQSAVNASKLGANHAVLFTPSSGDLAGRFFLVIDANGSAGYQTAQDFVIELFTPVDLSFTAETFT
jgi:Ca2+-binding RTX toxin-like protein